MGFDVWFLPEWLQQNGAKLVHPSWMWYRTSFIQVFPHEVRTLVPPPPEPFAGWLISDLIGLSSLHFFFFWYSEAA